MAATVLRLPMYIQSNAQWSAVLWSCSYCGSAEWFLKWCFPSFAALSRDSPLTYDHIRAGKRVKDKTRNTFVPHAIRMKAATKGIQYSKDIVRSLPRRVYNTGDSRLQSTIVQSEHKTIERELNIRVTLFLNNSPASEKAYALISFSRTKIDWCLS